ncbi:MULTISPECIES: prolyl hydroxylase family protein [unclassified Sphingomonas]|uniref:prolyl hydroxylase family protein n=1 Tax=unclassified Sphingomonas TaxID=196159 RepID=UPI000701E81A|nr:MULTISPECIES: 2OG-Fe(II) oxygenase [unclassified Sphingomonas]KQN03934.1 oxygenase [Sphingomonas sp. Leaf25]
MEAHPAPRPGFGSGFPAEPVIDHMLAQAGVQRVPSPKLTLFIRRAMVPPELCAALIERIDAKRRPSTIADANGDPTFRTSETCDLDSSDPVVAAAEALIHGFSGLDPAHGEPLQGQRYAVGQEFKAHTDYFDPQGRDFARYCSVAGQRTWTVMLYLNEPGAGGATRFKGIDKIVQPETGKLLAWNNLRSDGTPNPATLHHGMKVREGAKYVLTKWFRERVWG